MMIYLAWAMSIVLLLFGLYYLWLEWREEEKLREPWWPEGKSLKTYRRWE